MNTIAQVAKKLNRSDVKRNPKNNGIHMGKDTTGDVRNLYALLAQATDDERIDGYMWYPSAHNDAVRMAEHFNLPLWTICQILSVISPQRRWERNVYDCERTIEAHSLPPEERIAYLSSFRIAAPAGWQAFQRAWQILDGTLELIRKGAPKTYDFAKTIESPDTYGATNPVIDSHAGAAWSDEYHLTPGCYAYSLGLYTKIADAYRTVAAAVGMMCHQVQAIIWVVRRRLLGSASPSSL
jgi:hypothetical protein